MKTSVILIQGLRSLSRYKVRTGVMMLGSLIGVAALVFVVSVGRGAEHKILSTVERLFSASSIFVTSGGNLLTSGPRGDSSRMTLDDMNAIAAAVPSIEVWDPLQVIDPAPVRRSEASTTARVIGQSERAERVWERAVVHGQYFGAAEVAHAARVALIGPTVERTLFAGDDCLGADILIGGASFRVVGVLEAMGTDAHGLDRDNEIVVPISTAMRRLMNVDTIRGAKILVKDPSQVAPAAERIAEVLRDRHAIAKGQPNDFSIVTPSDVERLVGKARRVFFVFLPLVAAIALFAGAVVSATLMLLSVNERTTEIGLRQAVGARPRDIALQFLSEAATTTLLGGIAGVLAGAAAAYALAERLALAAFFSPGAALLALALSVATGLVAGVLPARRAAARRPAEALR